MGDPTIRMATHDDSVELESLMRRSTHGLSRDHYSLAQIEAALTGAMGIDRQLIDDQTYYLIECDARIEACGGWSWRRTLFGSDERRDRDDTDLDPAHDAAKIRAFFVDPAYVRQGLASMILEHCEDAARRAGFTSFELMSTLPGVPFYVSRGYAPRDPIQHELPDGTTIQFVPMEKHDD